MSILGNLLNTKKVECPRCMGKGEVDFDDIKRLNMELKWIPGPCAYCNGNGNVSSKMESNIPSDMTYLTKDISMAERKRIINGETDALNRAEWYNSELDNFIIEVEFLHFKGNMNSELIVDFFLSTRGTEETDRTELLNYVEQIITKK